jgi:O-antigen/teichoic acid export membrane protein
MAKKLWAYSFYVFLNTVAAQLVLYTDNLVVGAFINAAAVAFYSIGGSIVAYSRQIVAAVSTTFTPMASSFEASGKLDHLRRLLIHGTRATLCVSLPVSIALFFRGATFIRLWMGDEYAQVSGTIVRILIVNQIFAIANTTGGAIAYGMERHKPLAFWGMGVALCNLGLSIYLVRHMGLYGVAWGTVIAGLGVDLLVWPRYIAKMLNLSVGTYIWQAWSRVAIASIPYAFACYFADRHWHVSNLWILSLQITGTLPVFALGLALVFWAEFSFYIRAGIPWLRGRKSPKLVGLD